MTAETDGTPCRIVGPYLPVGDTDWECRTHGVLAELRDPTKAGDVVRRVDLFCPVGRVVDAYAPRCAHGVLLASWPGGPPSYCRSCEQAGHIVFQPGQTGDPA